MGSKASYLEKEERDVVLYGVKWKYGDEIGDVHRHRKRVIPKTLLRHE
jgi:hypothetical protein